SLRPSLGRRRWAVREPVRSVPPQPDARLAQQRVQPRAPAAGPGPAQRERHRQHHQPAIPGCLRRTRRPQILIARSIEMKRQLACLLLLGLVAAPAIAKPKIFACEPEWGALVTEL